MDDSRPVVELIYRAENGAIQRKQQKWRRPATAEALTDWLESYFERLDAGYQPQGYTQAPRPHCARIYDRGQVRAEWMRR